MNKSQRRQIEREFYNYKNNKQMAAEYVASHALDGFAVDYSKERVQSSQKNGIESKVLAAISKEEAAWKWALVFEKTLERFLWTNKDELIRLRYIKRMGRFSICNRIGIANSTYTYWIEEIAQVAYLWAKEYKLF